jgi:hypothetical protein
MRGLQICSWCVRLKDVKDVSQRMLYEESRLSLRVLLESVWFVTNCHILCLKLVV